MKKLLIFTGLIISALNFGTAYGQENETIFRKPAIRQSGGYAAISNKFTTINGDFANMAEIYGGWFINRKLMVGLSAAGTTNYVPVPSPYINYAGRKVSYQYGQAGLITEYVVASHKKVHFNVNLMAGAGFIGQYDRHDFDEWEWDFDDHDDACAFFVMEPGVQVEFNLLKWMRFSPGVSYRRAFGSKSPGLSDNDLSNLSYNVTFKFGFF